MKYILFLSLVCLGCGDPSVSVWEKFHGQTMGTSFSIKYLRPPGIEREVIEGSILSELSDFDQLMSNWNPKSWVTGFNKSRTTEWQQVAPEVMKILKVSRKVYLKSKGGFDVTISPLIEWWGFGASESMPKRSERQLNDLKAVTGMGKIEMRPKKLFIRKTIPELEINCSATAKGFGVDLLADNLRNHGINNFLIEIGGETRVMGRPEERDSWVMGVRRPDTSGEPVFARVKMGEGLSLATSGDYLNAFQENGQRFSHIIDPRTGSPVEHKLTSVSVMGKNCADVDAMATACMVLGEIEGRAMIERMEGFEAFFIVRSPEGYETLKTDGFPLLESP